MSPKVTSVIPSDQSIPDTQMKPSTREDVEATVDVQKQAISESQASVRAEEVSETLVELPKQPEQYEEDGDDDTSAFPGIVKGPLITRIIAEKEKDAPEIPVENDDEALVSRDFTDAQDGSTSGILKGPSNARIITENRQEGPETNADDDGEV
jgi:hypothetical protein